MNPVHTLIAYFFKIHFIIILPATPRSPKWIFLCSFPTKIVYAFLISSIRATRPASLILLPIFFAVSRYFEILPYLMTPVIFGKEQKLQL
jgi:hypothetical protein